MCVCMMATALVGCGKTDSGAATDSKTEESAEQSASYGEKKWKLGYSSLAFIDES